ncbi:hypothetical protein [Paenibacillus wulumuqiensis]|uniref:hypothetical protein n=1 Tax=Paenibacillus wulumuqiensis TaxID=1567107 RepID=UPI000619F6CF|nr:hypothetical protein [Paenibacillus wulumuqiensis]
MKFITSIVLGLASSAFASPSIVVASAENNYAATYHALSPTQNTKKILDSVQVKKNEDGDYHLRVEDTKIAGQIESYEVKVDYEKLTYEVVEIPTLIENISETAKQYNSVINSTYNNQEGITANALKTYSCYVKATTYNPVNIQLNYTRLGWAWGKDSSLSYPSTFRWRLLDWWDAQPSSAGTNWYYVRSQYNNDPVGSGQSAQATHVNHDFVGGLAGTTYATHYISITPKPNGQYGYYVDLSTSGTAGHLLHIKIDAT